MYLEQMSVNVSRRVEICRNTGRFFYGGEIFFKLSAREA